MYHGRSAHLADRELRKTNLPNGKTKATLECAKEATLYSQCREVILVPIDVPTFNNVILIINKQIA